jgi:hypothetical protein
VRWYIMPVEDLPPQEYRDRAERFHRTATELSDPIAASRFEAMAADAMEIAESKSREFAL